MDTNGYQVTHMEDIACQREDHDLNLDAVFRPSIDTPFSPSNFKKFELNSMAEKPTVTDQENNR